MLTINEEQMGIFEQLQFLKLKQQMSKVLSDEVTEWEEFDPKKQRRLIAFLFNEAQKARMILDAEYILFSLICMSSDEDSQSFLGRDDVENILLDEDVDNEEKLIKLSNLTTIEIKKIKNAWKITRREDDA